MPKRSNTIWAVFTTDSWHTYTSRQLIGTAINLKGVLNCVNDRQRATGLKPISKEQAGLLHTINQTQSDSSIDGEYLVERIGVWDGHND